MNLLGIHFKMLIGEEKPDTAPLRLNQTLQSVAVTHNDDGRSGFELTFQMGRTIFDLRDYPLLKDALLRPGNRVILVVFFSLTRHVLMDGIITQRQPALSGQPGGSTLTVTGEDLSVMLDLDVRQKSYSNMDHKAIVEKILDRPDYDTYGLEPDVFPPLPGSPHRNQDEGVASQHDTDRDYIQTLARSNGYVFYIRPASEPGKNIAYWGPPQELTEKQEALRVNMGPESNVESISFQYDGLAPHVVRYRTPDGQEHEAEARTRDRQRAREPVIPLRATFLVCTGPLSEPEAQARASGMADRSLDEAVTAQGELDALRYGDLLRPFSEVELLGAGESHDGTYRVKSVTHQIDIRQGSYTQSFTLAREGFGVGTRLRL